MPAYKQKKYISFLTGILLMLNFVAVVLILLSYVSVYINPAKFSLPALAGLAYPLFLALNLLFIVLWIFIRAKYALLTLFIILIGWNHIARLVQFNPDSVISKEDNTIKTCKRCRHGRCCLQSS